jgi:hypothetical protein
LEAERKDVVNEELAGLRPVPRLSVRLLENRLAEWRRLLRQSTTQGRAVLQRVLRGRITFVPEGTGYVFTAPTRWDKLFTGIMAPMPAFLAGEPAAGLNHITPEDTFDADYGRLLEAAARRCVKG